MVGAVGQAVREGRRTFFDYLVEALLTLAREVIESRDFDQE